MRSGPVELQPAREFVQRMHELEAELQRARQAQRRLKADPDASSRWGLETRAPAQQEEGWFLTYLDMMTLLLVAMIVMLAFSGGVMRRGLETSAKPALQAPTVAQTASTASAPPQAPAITDGIPAPDLASPYPAAPPDSFEQSAYPSDTMAAVASAYPTPADLAPKPPAAPDPAAAATHPQQNPNELAAASSQAGAGAAAASPTTRESPDAATQPPASPEPSTTPPAPSVASPAPNTVAAEQTSPSQTVPTQEPPAQPDQPVNAQSEGQSLAADLPLNELGSEVEVIVNKRSVSLRINSEILFGTGQADLSPHGLTVLRRMAQALSKSGYDITVEGHTDSVAVRGNGRYPSNWELSSARAGSVVRYFQANGVDKAHLKAVGYADTRPLASNQNPDGRARNRRVELVIEKPEANPDQTPKPAAPADTPPAAPGR